MPKFFESVRSRNLKTRHQPAALVIGDIGLVRSLGEAGIPVVVGGKYKTGAVYVSRYACDKIVFPPFDTPAFIEQLICLGKQFKERPVVFTDLDKVVLAFSRNREILSNYYRFPLPEEELVEDLADKPRFARLAEKHRLPVPQSFLPRNIEELQQVSKTIQYPCILKPAHHDLWNDPRLVDGLFEGRNKKAIKIHNAAELISTYEWVQTISSEMVLQEFVEGRDEQLYVVQAYLNAQSEPMGCFVGRKIRTHPIHFGMGCYTEGVIDKEVETIGLETLKRVGYRGIADIDLKRDSVNGSVKIIEVNPRCSLWNYLATRSGVNLPALAYSDLIGQEWKLREPYRVGLRWWYFKEDLKSLIEYRDVGEWSIRQWLRSLLAKKVYHVFSWNDPVPALYSFLVSARNKFKRVLKKD